MSGKRWILLVLVLAVLVIAGYWLVGNLTYRY